MSLGLTEFPHQMPQQSHAGTIPARNAPAALSEATGNAYVRTRHLVFADRAGCSAARHGDRNAYNYAGCRCPDARADRLRYDKELAAGHQRMVDGTGTRRRLQALAVIGWPVPEIARRLGVTPRWLRNWRTQSMFQRRTAERVEALYDTLSMIPGPSSRASEYALEAGWMPPLAWDEDAIDDPDGVPQIRSSRPATGVDDVVVARCLDGQSVGRALTKSERLEVVNILRARGQGTSRVARLLGCSGSTARALMELAS